MFVDPEGTHETTDIRKSSIEGFDDLMIIITENRIIQEITLSSALRTRGAIAIAFSGFILGIMFLGGWNTITGIFTNGLIESSSNLLNNIPSLFQDIGIASFVFSIAAGFMVILPQKWTALMEPKELNNELCGTLMTIARHFVKTALMRDLEIILEKNSELAKRARVSFWFLIAGLICFSLSLLFSPSGIIMKFLNLS